MKCSFYCCNRYSTPEDLYESLITTVSASTIDSNSNTHNNNHNDEDGAANFPLESFSLTTSSTTLPMLNRVNNKSDPDGKHKHHSLLDTCTHGAFFRNISPEKQ
jgi:hypothetical protein